VTPEQFAAQLQPLADKVGGAVAAGLICDVDQRTIRFWLRGRGNPNLSTQTGAIKLLTDALANAGCNYCVDSGITRVQR